MVCAPVAISSSTRDVHALALFLAEEHLPAARAAAKRPLARVPAPPLYLPASPPRAARRRHRGTVPTRCPTITRYTSKETQAYLGLRPHRFEFTFTPKHASWLNIVETMFSKIARTMLRGIRVASKQELIDRIHFYFTEINGPRDLSVEVQNGRPLREPAGLHLSGPARACKRIRFSSQARPAPACALAGSSIRTSDSSCTMSAAHR